MSNHFSVSGNLVDFWKKQIYPVKITIQNGFIYSIEPLKENPPVENSFILPGFIDSHIHIESSMLMPSEFAKLAVVHGTVASVSDPHEIANVCGMQGVEFMIENGKTVPFKFYFGAPSCVPATNFETAGGSLNSNDVATLLQKGEVKYLSEMMNFPGVLYADKEVLKKIVAAKAVGKPVDGHAPGLRGTDAKKYIDAGISTDHECFTKEEALDKLSHGMKIIIREGSAAKNFEALIDLLPEHHKNIMFCSDDKHPDSLVSGHINQLCARAIAKNINLFKIIQVACINPVLHYDLNIGLLRKKDPADFIVVKDLASFEVLKTYINGVLVAENGKSFITTKDCVPINNFECHKINVDQLLVPFHEQEKIFVIEALDGQLITNKLLVTPKIADGNIVANIENDILKLVVVNRYMDAKPAICFIKNFGLKSGAIASSVAHDSHNIIAVGTDDETITSAINAVIETKGGISCTNGKELMVLALPIAGLMSSTDGYKVAESYTAIDKMCKQTGSTLSAPFMTLSFMALLVIPNLKLSDKGLFDGDSFSFV